MCLREKDGGGGHAPVSENFPSLLGDVLTTLPLTVSSTAMSPPKL